MTLKESLAEITRLPWRFAEADNDKVMPTTRIFGWRIHDPSKEICIGRIDSTRDARYACHAANMFPYVALALRLLLEERKRERSKLSRSRFEFCELMLTKAETLKAGH
jgi:hypothetical protein